MNFLVRRLRGRRRAQGWPPGPAPRDKPPGRSIRAIDPNYLSVLSNLEMVERATPSTRRTVPPATTLLSKFLREGDTVAASAAGISGDPRAPAALTSMAAWSFSTWLTLALMTVAFLVARTPLWAVLLAGRAQATDLVAAALAFILITLAFIVLLS
eukprot:CAMPEP_0196638820 /NCGR_PEP_ID=MMETSP1085-20130531/1557_1 /TAXON_ID=41879 ORGANISM="Pycnococcus sp, Strain CCMP1998" /NCGR_SAMPLE_ID=MMETSP1085 /ASSEMBLY_ACC=CAM_ASM_000807 /LENGTH=155 /DNA_ID=CAMNT_0041967725 /DNA_START=61 /DNA_END=528 /DNA_ORIENTATION=+